MVAVLWDSGQKEAALALEEIWNSALGDSTFQLHCAYPRTVFSDETELRSVCELHSHALKWFVPPSARWSVGFFLVSVLCCQALLGVHVMRSLPAT